MATPQHDEHDANRNGASETTLLGSYLLLGIEVLHEGMGLGERRMSHARRQDKCQSNSDAQQERRRGGSLRHAAQCQRVKQRSQGKADNDNGDARRDFQGERTHVGIVAAHIIYGRTLGNDLPRIDLTLREIARDQLIERAIKQVGHAHELIDIGRRLAGFPFRHRLAGNAQQHGKLLLRHVALLTEVQQVVPKLHF